MKRYVYTLLSFLLFIAVIPASAEIVSRSAAKTIATKYFAGEKVSLSWEGKAANASEPAFRVYNNENGGWVIISGEDATAPVLGYADNGKFATENMPENIRWWMDRMARNIEKARTEKMAQTPQVKAKWAAVGTTIKTKKGLRTASTGAKLLETANWDQSDPWNSYCPKMSGESSKAYAGCVATAMAIVLRYNQWPAKGKGVIEGYDSISSHSIEGKSYDWANMDLNTYSDAIGSVLYDLGTMVQMEYSASGSGALSCDIIPALAKHMSYSASARELYRYNFDNQEWLSMLKAEIDANRPLLYGGSDTGGEGGHQFVLDGYDSDNNVHINWGWSGENNGYFPIVNLGNSSMGWIFSDYDSAIFGLVKDENGTDGTNVELYLDGDTSNSIYGISLASGTIAKGSSFKIDAGWIINNNYYSAYSGSVKAALVDRNGDLKEFISGETTLSLTKLEVDEDDYLVEGCYDKLEDISCSITKDLELGDAIALYYKLADGTWSKIGGYNYAYKYNSNKYAYNTIYEMGVQDIPMIRVDKTYASGESYYYSVRMGQKYATQIDWYFDGTKKVDGTYQHDGYVKLSSGDHTIKCVLTFTDGSTQTLTQKIKVN